MSDTNEVAKKGWISTGFGNKLGSILWALVTVFYLVSVIFLNQIFKIGGSELQKIGGPVLFLYIANFVLYLLICVGIFLNNGLCSAVAKAWGIATLLVDIAVVVLTIVLFAVVFQLIKNNFGIDIPAMVSSTLDSLKNMSSAAKGAAKAAGETAKSLGVDAGAVAAAAGSAVSASPEVAGAATVFAKAIFVIFGTCVATILTIIAGFTLAVKEGPKSRLVALVLCLFLGAFGGHCLYAKKTGKAILMSIFTVTVILFPITAIIWVIDFFKILCGAFKDNNKEPIKAWV